MEIELYKDAVLTCNMPEYGLCAGDIGTVIEKHEVDNQIGYSLEFFDMTGKTIAVITVLSKMIRSPETRDIPTVRHSMAA